MTGLWLIPVAFVFCLFLRERSREIARLAAVTVTGEPPMPPAPPAWRCRWAKA